MSNIADDEYIPMFGAFVTTFVILTLAFWLKYGFIVGLCVGFASAVVVLVLSMILWDYLTGE